jgi:hypothetical protein
VEALLKRDSGVVANSRNITKSNPFAASANLAPVDGDMCPTGGVPRTRLKVLGSRRDKCIALPQKYIKLDDSNSAFRPLGHIHNTTAWSKE